MLPGSRATGRLAALVRALRRCVACRALPGLRSGFTDSGFHGAPGDRLRVLCLTKGIVRGCGVCTDGACTCTGHGYARRASDAGTRSTRSTPREHTAQEHAAGDAAAGSAGRCGSRRRDAAYFGRRCRKRRPLQKPPWRRRLFSGGVAAGSAGRFGSRRRDAAYFGRRCRKRRPLRKPPQKRRLFRETPPPEAPAAAGAAVETPPVFGGAAAGSVGRCGSRRRGAACFRRRRRRWRRPLRKPPQKRRLFQEAPPPEAPAAAEAAAEAPPVSGAAAAGSAEMDAAPGARGFRGPRLWSWTARHGAPVDSMDRARGPGLRAMRNAPGAETPGALYRA